MISGLFEKKVMPLYAATITNTASIRLAESLGFAGIAAGEFAGYIVQEESHSGLDGSKGARLACSVAS
jgi:hypothetical protein